MAEKCRHELPADQCGFCTSLVTKDNQEKYYGTDYQSTGQTPYDALGPGIRRFDRHHEEKLEIEERGRALKKKKCKLEGCEGSAMARGLCPNCYGKWRNGDEEMTRLFGEFKKVRGTKASARSEIPQNKESAHEGKEKEEKPMKNKLIDLNNHLFAQMERLSDEDLGEEEIVREINRSKAVSNLAAQIIGNAKLALDAHKAINDGLVKTAPEMIGMKSLGEA